jgi:hypothetical protein
MSQVDRELATHAPAEARKRVFLLSPARCSGDRARMLLDPRNRSELAQRIQSRAGAPIGEVFAFLSSLYFRGKLTYGRTFARPPARVPGVLVITPGAGLCDARARLTAAHLRKFSQVAVQTDDERYTRPLLRDAMRLAEQSLPDTDVVLLGSIASAKYTDILLRALGDQLLFPSDFVGRGDMSRGGLLLRSSEAHLELTYTKVAGATLHGPRVPKLPRKLTPALKR